MKVTIYHNPRCSKSRQTLELLQNKGHDPDIIEYLKTPPSVEQLDEILRKLNKQPEDIIRTKESVYQDLKLDTKNLDRNGWIQILVEHPILMERPIVVCDDKAVLGRPPENILKIL